MQDKIKIYIDDLTKENYSLLAMNEKITEQRKALKKRLCDLTDGFGSTDDMKEMGALCGRLLGMAMIFRQNCKDIRKNSAIIRGLRDGSIKEI